MLLKRNRKLKDYLEVCRTTVGYFGVTGEKRTLINSLSSSYHHYILLLLFILIN